MAIDKRRTNEDRVDAILHLAKVIGFTRDRKVIEDLCRTIRLLEPLVDHTLLTAEQEYLLSESVRRSQSYYS
ncbi:hypothetical protein KAU45_08735 [bacterium]|nr:hypothetical protein [bacterium]